MGPNASVFSVRIEKSKPVGLLKEAIKEKQPNTIQCHAHQLQLYLARKDDEWLHSQDLESVPLDTENRPLNYEQMDPSLWLSNSKYFGQNFTPQEGEVHVLVKVPARLVGWIAHEMVNATDRMVDAIAIEEVVDVGYDRQELKYYQERGRMIQENCQRYCAQILDKIDELYRLSDRPLPFICVEGSSGMGKSQLAFALEGRRPYFYWLATRLRPDSQRLYNNFKSISAAFREVVIKDEPTKKGEEIILKSISSVYQTDDLWTYGFIVALLEYCSSEEQQSAKRMIRFENRTLMRVERHRRSAVLDVIRKMKADNKVLPFFVLDEMTSNSNIDADGKNMAAFQRNVFRACGLVVIIMGTDSKLTNLKVPSGGSFKEPCKWASLVPRFPPYQLVLHSARERHGWSQAVTKYPVLERIAIHSRGRFARYFIDEVVNRVLEDDDVNLCDLMDDACAAVSQRTYDGKHFLCSEDGKRAQLMAISYTNAVRNVADEPHQNRRRVEVGASSMHLHFANLVDEQVTDMTLSHSMLETSNTIDWHPKCCFPAIDNDMLFYLAILGGKGFPSYYKYRNGVYSVKCIFRATEMFPVHENTNAVCHDYKTFENMVAHAIFCSSRRNGVRGIAFDEFVSSLLGEFRDELWEPMVMYDHADESRTLAASDLVGGYCAGVQRLKDAIIPFLAPPNAEWPEWILNQRSYGCKFGHLVRASNGERCDVYVQEAELDKETDEKEKPMLICECKYWEEDVDISTMNRIINGLNERWKWEVVFVFCVRLVDLRSCWGHPSVGCVKINCRNGEVTWVFQPVQGDRHQLLIVLEVRGCYAEERFVEAGGATFSTSSNSKRTQRC